MTSVAKAGWARSDCERNIDDRRQYVGKVDDIPREWIELVAYYKWASFGKSHGHDLQDWLESEQELQSLFRAARLEPRRSQNDQRWVAVLQSLPRDAALNALQNLVTPMSQGAATGQSSIHLFNPEVMEQDAPAENEPEVKERALDSSKKSQNEEEAVPAMDRLRALRNRDALTLMSDDDRRRYASRFAAITRSGESPGRVIADGISIDEAAEKAQKVPGFRPTDYSIRYVIPPDQPLLEGNCLS